MNIIKDAFYQHMKEIRNYDAEILDYVEHLEGRIINQDEEIIKERGRYNVKCHGCDDTFMRYENEEKIKELKEELHKERSCKNGIKRG